MRGTRETARVVGGAVVLLAVLAVSGGCETALAHPVTVADGIDQALAVADGDRSGGEDRLQAVDLLRQVYSDRHGLPGWVAGGAPRPIARAMVEVVRSSSASGLTPRDYHIEALERLMALPYDTLPAASRARGLARLELLLSDAFVQLANDQAQGRLQPATLLPSRPNPGLAADLRKALQQVFAGAPPGAVIEAFTPHDPGYLGMRAALARYLRLAANGVPPLIAAGPALVKGDSGPRVEALVARLQSTGDIAATPVPDVFGLEVAEALERYQARHGLHVDAIAGPATLAVLNMPAAHWIDTLRVNMERRRELPAELPPTRLLVNIANFRATFFTGGDPQSSEKVIVGTSYQKTPEISSRIAYLVLNPNWDVPASIASKEILPAARSNPEYFSRHDYEVLQGWGTDVKRVDPMSVDWKTVSAARLPYHFREPAGPDNPLGRVKFMFSNSHDVYMHDTPARALFDASQRTFSHGCIRIDNAMRLAAALLRADGQPDPGLLLIQAVDQGANRHVELNHPIPIYIVYMTAWAQDLDTVEFRPDVYNRDAGLLAALDAAPGSFHE